MNTGMEPMRGAALALALTTFLALLSACGGKKEPAAPAVATAPAAPQAPGAAPEAAGSAASVPQVLARTDQAWSAEALEDLLAPVALYPDVVLGQMLVAATNPQEVLDAGNWLLQNQGLKSNALDDAAANVGFTPPVRGLLQSPEVIDMMCSHMAWTRELGQAFVNDQPGVLDAVQRLRDQAVRAGNLRSSDQLKVDTQVQDGQQVVTVSPPNPQVVYVPQYDPMAAYAPAPVVAENEGYSTDEMVTTGALAFGAGILIGNFFGHDNDDYYRHGYYQPRYYGPPMPYYPPYPYRPPYHDNGYHPSNGYDRPPHYPHPSNSGPTLVNPNSGSQGSGGDYWHRHDNPPPAGAGAGSIVSPITGARPSRPGLSGSGVQAGRQPGQPPTAAPEAWRGQSGYRGSPPGVGPNLPGPTAPNAAPTRPPMQAAPPASSEGWKGQSGYNGTTPLARPLSPGTTPERATPSYREPPRPQQGPSLVTPPRPAPTTLPPPTPAFREPPKPQQQAPSIFTRPQSAPATAAPPSPPAYREPPKPQQSTSPFTRPQPAPATAAPPPAAMPAPVQAPSPAPKPAAPVNAPSQPKPAPAKPLTIEPPSFNR